MSIALDSRLAGRFALPAAILFAALALISVVRVDSASAAAEIESFDLTTSTTQAGGHPDLTTTMRIKNPGLTEAARNVAFEAPEGVFGNPEAVTRCRQSDFALTSCSTNSQVGIITIRANRDGDPNSLLGIAPVYSVMPGEHQTALLAFTVPILRIPIQIPITVRTESDYGLRFTVSEISQTTPLRGFDLELWGFPAERDHNAERFEQGTPGNPPECALQFQIEECIETPLSSTEPERPLTSNPTVCTGQPLVSRLSVQTYQDPGNLAHAVASYPPTTDCYREKFNPVLTANTTTTAVDTATGLDVILKAPQFLSRAASPSQLKSSIITLPPGLTVNPDAADGQTACTDEQAAFGTPARAQCPETSKIGTFEIRTPALDGPLLGDLYIGEPKPDNQYRVVMVANGFGINAKFVSSVIPDPQTGQVRIHTQELPQVAFEEFIFHLFSSDRGLLATPTRCSNYELSAQFFPWNDKLADQSSSQFFSLNSGPDGKACPGPVRPFSPRLAAGTSNANAGAFSNFALKLDRDDGDQFLGDLNFVLPPGFTGDLSGISYCPEGAIAAAASKSGRSELIARSCPSSAQIGTSNVAAGPGSHPFHAVGRMYLAGPLQGAPLSLVAITPALAGPYDYGNVVVRVALHIDPLTAQVRAVSDRMPQIIGGIPIRMRSIQVNIDRPNFTINPTNCSRFAVASQGIGDEGAVADFSSPFFAVNCATLPFKPKMTVRHLGGRKATRRSRNPALRLDLRTRPGDANLKSIKVTLPNAFNIDQRHLGNICSEKELVENECAGRTPIGTATTRTPLLDQPLSGHAYAVSGSGGLPRLAFILKGQVTVVPRAETVTDRRGRLQTTVPVVPDVPIGHFRFNLFGGKTGYLVNTRSLCAGKGPVVVVRYESQNGKKRTERVKVKSACGKKKSRRKRAGR